jgi:hypothetical protein
MSRRVPTHRRAVLHGACAATLTFMAAPAAGAAKAAELDGELIALIQEGTRLLQEPSPPMGPENPPTLAKIMGPKPWDAVLAEAARMPARTPEGLRAKAAAVADMFALGDRRNGLPHWDRNGQYLIAWSLLRDLLGDAIPPAHPSPWPDYTTTKAEDET